MCQSVDDFKMQTRIEHDEYRSHTRRKMEHMSVETVKWNEEQNYIKGDGLLSLTSNLKRKILHAALESTGRDGRVSDMDGNSNSDEK